MSKTTAILVIALVLPFLVQATDFGSAPDLQSPDLNGNPVCLDSLIRSGPVFVGFWALWCEMCIKELDALRPYYPELDSLGIRFVAVNIDQMRSVPKVKPFALSHKWEYTVVIDPDSELRNLYHVQTMPTSFIIDRTKKIVFIHQGYKPGDEDEIVGRLRELSQEDTLEP
jgi:cytochrome c biogenesis protein CcmG/thiol:disulfide interchange protein DsbE